MSDVGLTPGTKIERYEIRERIALGGQSIIYKCYDPLLERVVALKQMSTHLAEDKKFIERFRNEARILARLGNDLPEIVTIHDIIEDKQGLFIVMEFVPGVPIEATLSQNPGPVEPRATLQILWKLCGALYKIHAAGIIHRDLKPSNIIIREGLNPTITDFGVAASADAESSMVMGTTKYMAPELFEAGKKVDGRADIYSLGMIAYEMLLGREKFNEVFADIVSDQQAQSLRWMKWHCNEELNAPALHEINPDIPVSMSHIVVQMMSKDPNLRFDSTESLGKAIKLSFSPKTKTTNGQAMPQVDVSGEDTVEIVPPNQQAQNFVSSGAAPSARHIEDHPTVAIPKKKLSRRTKVLAAAVLVMLLLFSGVLLIVSDISKSKRISREANVAYVAAMGKFNDGDFNESLKMFRQIHDSYPDLKQGLHSLIFIELSKANLAIQAGDWNSARQGENDAKDQLRELQKKIQPTPENKQWLENISQSIESFYGYRLEMQSFSEFMQRMNDMYDDGDMDSVLEAIDDEYGSGDQLPEKLRDRLETFRTNVMREKYYRICREMVDSGHNMRLEGNTVDARSQYLRAKARVNSEAASILTLQQRQGLQAEISGALEEVNRGLHLQDIIDQVAQARSSEDTKRLLSALKSGVDFEGLPKETAGKWSWEIKQLEQTQQLQEAQELLKSGQVNRAIETLEELLKEYPDNQAAGNLLTGLKLSREFEEIKADGLDLYRQRRWAEALEKLSQADQMRKDSQITDALRECQYRIKLNELRRYIRDKQYTNAELAAEQARRIWPEKTAEEIVPILVVMKNQQKLETTIREAGEAIEARQYSKAKSILKPLKGVPVAYKLTTSATYLQNMSFGKTELQSNNYKTALGFFRVANNNAQNQEERDESASLMEEAREKLKAQEQGTP